MRSIPNILTISRIVAIPIIVVTFQIPDPLGVWITFSIFIAAAFTDFFDGWLARKLNQTSAFGQAFDPIADKLLVASILILLQSDSRISIFAVIAIISRELLIAGLREYLSGKLKIPVSLLAKWKTAIQFLGLSILILYPAIADAPGDIIFIVGDTLIWGTVVLTWITAIPYLIKSIANLRG